MDTSKLICPQVNFVAESQKNRVNRTFIVHYVIYNHTEDFIHDSQRSTRDPGTDSFV